MAGFVIRQFIGEIPVVAEQLLPEGAAMTAQNTKLTHGDLRAWKQPSAVHTPTKAGTKLTIYRYGESEATDAQHWFTWTTDVDVVRAPIDGDTTERTYFTGDGAPKKTDSVTALGGAGTDYPNAAYLLGVPMPDTALASFTVTGTATDPDAASISAAYVMTYVTGWGEEGRPSDPIGIATFKPGQSVDLSNLPVGPGGNYNLTHKRLYRSNTGSSGTNYQFVVELPLATTTYSDTTASENLGEVCPTYGWEEPPADGKGMTLGANGNCIMFAGKTIYPSIPFVLYAYPPEYQQSTESEIVGVGAFGQSFAILTKSNPYVLMGIDPASYSMVRLGSNQACVSKRSIVEMMEGVIYASPDGLWLIDNRGLSPLTQTVFSKEQWQSYKPESIHAYELDGRYHMFYNNGVEQGQIIFDFGRAPYVVFSDVHCTAAYNDPLRDSLYMAIGTDIVKWDAGAALTYVWKSKEVRSPWYVNLGYGKVEAEAYPVTFRLYADGALVHTEAVANDQPFRLPALPYRRFSVELEGTARVRGVMVAETGEEIARL